MLFTVLSAAVKPIELVGNLAAGAASAVFPPSSLCFGAAMYLINAARGVSATLDAIAELFGMLKDFTVRLKVYNNEDLSQELREKLTEILTTVIEIFARSTRVIKDGVLSRLKAFGKNVLLGNDLQLQGLVSKLDKLTQSEDLLVGAETLVETKKTSRNVEAVQVTLTETTAQLSQMSLTQLDMYQGLSQILSSLQEQKADAKEEKDVKHVEAVKKVLRPSVVPLDRFDEIKREHVLGSGDWVKDEEPLQDWISSKSPILWISGNPGSGKSFLTYTIITYLLEQFGDATGAAAHDSVGYFFFRDNKDQTRSFEQALRDIAFQIAQTDQAYAKHVISCVRDESEVSSIRSAWQKLFLDFYIEGDQQSSAAYVLLDGLDESFEEDRNIFFGLLKDVEYAGAQSRLHVAMLGRPQVIDELIDQLEQEVPSIHVDGMKNGADILHYVDSSIAKSRVLSKVSQKLKDEIIQTLTSKAGGMFMWVKLMIQELSKKSRESAIREALTKAPRGLQDMLKHVLVGFSESIKDVQDGEDLNDALMWVALAKRPLFLGELDAMLRLKSPDGEGVLNLEGRLRTQYASFFTLTRDDTLTTADLQAAKRPLVYDEEDAEAGAEIDDGVDDVENATVFDSNSSTTQVAFSHASISDFFRDAKQGKVSAGAEYPAIGVNLFEAQVKIAKLCINLLVDDNLLTRMKDAVSLRTYAGQNWDLHLGDLDFTKVDSTDKVSLALQIGNMLTDQKLLSVWSGSKSMFWFKAEKADLLLRLLKDSDVQNKLPETTIALMQTAQANHIEIFDPAIKYSIARWLVPEGVQWNYMIVMKVVYAYLKRKVGETVDKDPKMSAEDIRATAEFGGFEKTADWHRRLARALRDAGHYEAAIKEFEEAISLDPDMWIAKAGIAKLYMKQEKYEEAIQLDNEILERAGKDDKMTIADKNLSLWELCKRLAASYNAVVDAIDRSDGDLEKLVKYMHFALGYFKKAFSYRNTDYECIESYCLLLSNFADPGPPWANEEDTEQAETKHSDLPDIPTPSECYETAMDIIHDLADTQIDESHTNLVRCLYEYKYSDDAFFQFLARSAKETDQLEWLQGRYKEAISQATKDLKAVVAACLNLCLADLYHRYGNDEDKAFRIWQAVGTEGTGSTRVQSDIAFARMQALNELGSYCLQKALDDPAVAPKWIEKLEKVATKRKYGARIGALDTIPPSYITLYLASWYQTWIINVLSCSVANT